MKVLPYHLNCYPWKLHCQYQDDQNNNNPNTLTIYDLKKHGWKVVKQKSYIEVRTGISPYEDLKRRVQIVIKILQKQPNDLFP